MTERERLVRLIDNGPAHFCNGCYESPEERAESVEKLADYLIEQGYRKVDEDYAIQCTCYALGCQMAETLKRKVVEEIFSEIETFIIDQCFLTDAGVAKIYKKLVEVRKKYKEGQV